MTKIGTLDLADSLQKECLPITAESIGDIVIQCKQIKQESYDLIEFKAEHFNGITNLSQFWNAMISVSLQFQDDPLIISLRSKSLPAAFMTENDYINTISFIIKTSLCDAVEIEDYHQADDTRDMLEYAEEMGITAILSHEFETIPTAHNVTDALTTMSGSKCPVLRLHTPNLDTAAATVIDEAIRSFKKDHPDIIVLSDVPTSPIHFNN